MTHPLTDDMCEELSCFRLSNLGDTAKSIVNEGITHDMRAAYDLAIEHVYEIWNQLFEEVERDSTICWRFNRELSKMRPQQQEKNS